MSDDEYGDDDFETYDDDFDEPEEKPAEVVKSKARLAKEEAERDQLRRAMQEENRMARSSPAAHEVSTQKHSIHALGIASAPGKKVISDRDDYVRDSKGSDAKGFDDRQSAVQPPPMHVKKHGGSEYTMDFSAPILSTQTDPRMKRLQRLRGANGSAVSAASQGANKKKNAHLSVSGTGNCVFDMQEDSFVQLNIPPIGKFDYYHRNLRMLPPMIKQIGVPQELDSREMETNTDEIEVSDVGMQFSSGSDDTLLLDMIETVRSYTRSVKKNGGEADAEMSKRLVESIHANKYANTKKTQGGVSTVSTGTQMGDSGAQSSSKLGQFLQKSVELVDGLLGKGQEEDDDAGEYKDSGGDRSSADSNNTITPLPFKSSNKAAHYLPKNLFSARAASWKPLSTHATTDPLAWIFARSPTQIKASRLNSNLLCSVHPYSEINKGDKKPYRTVYCIWDLLAADTPIFLLEASGESNCVCFSSSQPHVILGGNEDSCLDLFDLRESSSFHQSKENAGTKGGKILRKPCYTTNFQRNSAAAKSLFSPDTDTRDHSNNSSGEHRGGIVQVEGIGGAVDGALVGANAVSQFISIDEYSTVLLWITMDAFGNNQLNTANSTKAGPNDGNDGSINLLAAVDDYGLAPWSTMKLTLSRKLECGRSPSLNTTMSLHDTTTTTTAMSAAGLNSSLLLNRRVLLGLVPGDSTTTFLYCNSRLNSGIEKVARLGEASLPNHYSKLFGGVDIESKIVMDTSTGYGNGTNTSHFSSTVTALCVTSCIIGGTGATAVLSGDRDGDQSKENDEADETQAASRSDGESTAVGAGSTNTVFYILAGRSDGTVDLYDMSINIPVMTWKPFDHITGGSANVAQGIVCVKWINQVSFLVVDGQGYVYLYDLSVNAEIPVLVDNSISNRVGGSRGRGNAELAWLQSGNEVAVSIPVLQSGLTSNISITVICPGSNSGGMNQIVTRRLNEKVGLASSKGNNNHTTDVTITSALKDTSTRVFQSYDHINHTTFGPIGSNYIGTGTERK